MDIQTVRDNLQNTIEGKKKMLAYLSVDPGDVVQSTMAAYLKINIEELKRILTDLNECEK